MASREMLRTPAVEDYAKAIFSLQSRGEQAVATTALAERLRRLGTPFLIEPGTRFAGQVGEQSTMFFLDPSGNALEFKAFRDIERELFAVPPAAG